MFIDIYVVSHAQIYHSLSHSAIKVWDFQAALDPRSQADTLCLRTLMVSRLITTVGRYRQGGVLWGTFPTNTPASNSQRFPKTAKDKNKSS